MTLPPATGATGEQRHGQQLAQARLEEIRGRRHKRATTRANDIAPSLDSDDIGGLRSILNAHAQAAGAQDFLERRQVKLAQWFTRSVSLRLTLAHKLL